MCTLARLSLLLLLVILASGCAKRSLIALVPDQDGRTGSISVSNLAGSVTLDVPYQATTLGDTKEPPTAPTLLGKDALDKTFKEALSIQPRQPLHFLLYFNKETTLASDSVKLLPNIMAAITERDSNDILVVGHTDTLGSKEYNTALSNSRALTVKELLVRQGAASDTIRTTSHGKENPLIPTGDNVNEPRNRRVEVVVR